MPEGLPLVTCLGCGCTCDDITLAVRDNRIVEAHQACELGVAWFGDGAVPAGASVDGRSSSVDAALDATAALLARSGRALVYVAPGLSCEAQREAVALADATRASLDTVTSDGAGAVILAAQALGRTGASLGEIRNRADVVVFWGLDPAVAYPRFWSRYAPGPEGVHIAGGRPNRHVIAVDIGEARGPADADLRVTVADGNEIAALTSLATIANSLPMAPTLDEIAAVTEAALEAHKHRKGTSWEVARQLVPLLTHGRYVAIVTDGESLAPRESNLARAEALVRLAQALNGPTRCALVTLRGGGNRVGADAVLTSQTGYPMAIDFSRGYPRYSPYDDARARLTGGGADAVVVLGDASHLADDFVNAVASLPHAVIGPRATEGRLRGGTAAVDTGIAGIHESGTALRLDDVPLPLRKALTGPPAAADILRQLVRRVAALPLPS
jgi:formylmethanofuran dehydrogenase subunit B